MGLLKPAQNTMAYLKMGLYGDTGSGKTWTASEVALGLHRFLQSLKLPQANKPVAFFDTETGSSFILPKFKSQGIELVTFNGSALKDLVQVMDEAEKECSILIIDSITNVWDEFTDAYMKKRKQNYIELWDWKPIKKEWRAQYRDRFVNSKLHIIMCGREGAIYTTEEQERNGKTKKTSVKSGTKMRAEGDTGYEPSILCEMEKVYSEGSGNYVRRCNVVKERFGLLDSKSFDNPTFSVFLPHVKNLNLGGEHYGLNTESNSEEMFDDDGNGALQKMFKRRDIALEELDAALTKSGLSGSSGDVKKRRIEVLEQCFGTSAKTAIESLSPERIEAAVERIKVEFLGAPSGKGNGGSTNPNFEKETDVPQ